MSRAEKRFTAKVEIKEGMTKRERDEVIISHLPFIKSVCRGVVAKIPSIRVDDILGVAVIGFMDALSRYDASMGVKLKSFAEQRIRGSIVDELRSVDAVGRHIRDMKKQVDKAKAAAESKHGPGYSSSDIAAQLEVSLEVFFEMERKSAQEKMIYLGVDGAEDTLDLSGGNDRDGEDQIIAAEFRVAVDGATRSLSEVESLVISLHHFEEMKILEISNLLDLSESRSSHIHAQAVLKIFAAIRRAVGEGL